MGISSSGWGGECNWQPSGDARRTDRGGDRNGPGVRHRGPYAGAGYGGRHGDCGRGRGACGYAGPSDFGRHGLCCYLGVRCRYAGRAIVAVRRGGGYLRHPIGDAGHSDAIHDHHRDNQPRRHSPPATQQATPGR
jgi:hypothetical protein